MLEQAVYAGRNHAVSLAAAVASVAGLGLFAPAARAGGVTRVALGSSIEVLVMGADGGA
jgi:hypothetical protein